MAHGHNDAVVEVFGQYLTSAAGRERTWAYRSVPLQLEVKMPVDHWRSYFETVEVADEVSPGLEEALALAEHRGGVVGRRALAELSVGALRTADATVAAWVTVMCWGAGPTNRWRLRQWHQSLALPTLAADLRRAVDLVEADRLAEAYVAAALPGCKESFLTKWLWMIGLDAQRRASTEPLVYDDRVDKVRRLLGCTFEGRNRAERWVDYCRTMAAWAAELNHRYTGWAVDAERLEQLMFQRDDTRGPCLFTWMRGDRPSD